MLLCSISLIYLISRRNFRINALRKVIRAVLTHGANHAAACMGSRQNVDVSAGTQHPSTQKAAHCAICPESISAFIFPCSLFPEYKFASLTPISQFTSLSRCACECETHCSSVWTAFCDVLSAQKREFSCARQNSCSSTAAAAALLLNVIFVLLFSANERNFPVSRALAKQVRLYRAFIRGTVIKRKIDPSENTFSWRN